MRAKISRVCESVVAAVADAGGSARHCSQIILETHLEIEAIGFGLFGLAGSAVGPISKRIGRIESGTATGDDHRAATTRRKIIVGVRSLWMRPRLQKTALQPHK